MIKSLRTLAVLVFAGVLAIGLTACGSDKKTGDGDGFGAPTTSATDGSDLGDDTGDTSDEGDVADEPDEGTGNDDNSGDASGVPNVCAGLDEATVEQLVGFPVTADGVQNDGDKVSCGFRAPLDAGSYAGANVTVIVEKQYESLDDVKTTVQNMDSTAEVVSVDKGDGGFYLAKGGFLEMRVLASGLQIGIGIITPMDETKTAEITTGAQNILDKLLSQLQ